MKKRIEFDSLKTLGMHAGAKPEIFRFAEKLRVKMTPPENKLWIFFKNFSKGF